MSCEMKGDDYENKRMILRDMCIAYCWTLRIRVELNMKQEGFPILTMGADGVSQVK